MSRSLLTSLHDSPRVVVLAAIVAASSFAYVACDSGSDPVKEPQITPDAGPAMPVDSGSAIDSGSNPQVDGGPTDCFLNPTNHFEIINACTDAVKINKNPVLPRLYPDGGLPPL